jgi:hypothetical protein
MSTTQELVNDHQWKNAKPQRKRKPTRFNERDWDDQDWEMDYDRYEKLSRKSRRNDREFNHS